MEITRKELKRLVATGAAYDVSNIPNSEMELIVRNGITKIAFAYGVNGCSGALFKGNNSGALYVIIGRVGNLWHVMA